MPPIDLPDIEVDIVQPYIEPMPELPIVYPPDPNLPVIPPEKPPPV